MANGFLTVLHRGIAAGWLILAVILLRVCLNKAPKWVRCMLWGIVAVRLICPVSLESPFSLIPRAGTVTPAVIPSLQPAVTAGAAATAPAGAASAATASGAAVQDWTHAAGILWLIGLAVLLGYAFVSWLWLRRRLREAVPWRENIWICDSVKSPFILGLFRPRIYLPSGGIGAETDYVIAHERAHLKRGDHWWKPLGFCLLAVYWFHPLVWAAYVLFCRDIELACDERVVREMDLPQRKAYSGALVSCGMQRRLVLVCPLAFGEVGVKERVNAVLHYKKPAFWLVLVAILACVAVAVCFLTDPKPEREAVLTEDAGGVVTAIPKEEDLLAEYEPFGVTMEDGILYYQGERVRYFLDGYESGDSVISRCKYYDELGTVDIHTERNDTVNEDGSTTLFGPITDIVPYPREEFGDRVYESDDSTAPAQEDVQLQSAVMKERTDQWEEALRPYLSLGLTYRYDSATDDFKLYYDGTEVRGLYDEVAGIWISEHTGNGTYGEDAIDLYAVYEGQTLVGLREATAEERAEWTRQREAVSATDDSYQSEQSGDGSTIAQLLEPYRVYGLTYEELSGSQGDLYYNGELLEGFWDQKPDGSVFTTQSSTGGGAGTACTVYDEEGNLTGIRIQA